MKNKLISFCLVLLLLAAFPLTAKAQRFDPAQLGTISVALVSQDGTKPMEGAELSVFHVATVAADENGTLFYAYTDAFSDCGVELDDPELVKTLETFVSGKDIPAQKTVTDAQGKAVCENLPLGLYFVKQTGNAEGFAPCASFLVTVPIKTENGYQYDVDASPKTDVVRLVDITIKKVWNTDKNAAIPQDVTVQLLRDEVVVQTATLNEKNAWQVMYADMPESDAYSIVEVNVPKGFTATYTQKGYTFTVTNTPSLAQTGQLIWPIPVLAMAGLCLIAVGTIVLRKTRNKNA